MVAGEDSDSFISFYMDYIRNWLVVVSLIMKKTNAFCLTSALSEEATFLKMFTA